MTEELGVPGVIGVLGVLWVPGVVGVFGMLGVVGVEGVVGVNIFSSATSSCPSFRSCEALYESFLMVGCVFVLGVWDL